MLTVVFTSPLPSTPPDGPPRDFPWPAAGLALLSLPIIFWRLADYSLINGDEAFYHYVARRMAATGDWLRLEFTGEHRVYDTFMNAPLQYWTRAALILVFGDNRWTVRLPSAVFGLLSVLMTARLAGHVAGRRAGFLAGLIQLTTLQFIYLHSARTGELETTLTFLLTLAALLFLRAVESGRSFWGHHLCLIALLNVKTPLIVVPLLAEALFFAGTPAARRRARPWAAGLALALPIGLTWHAFNAVYYWNETQAVIREMLEQASGKQDVAIRPPLGRLGNVRFYALVVLFGAFPYSLAYFPAMLGLAIRRRQDAAPWGWRLAFLHVWVVFAFFIAVAKFMPWYVIPAYPFLSVLLGGWLDQLGRRRVGSSTFLAAAAVLGLMLALRMDLLTFNPFSDRAVLNPAAAVTWRSFGGFHPAASAMLCIAAAAALMLVVRGLTRDAFPRVLAGVLTAAMVLPALVRVVSPLQYASFQSSRESLCERLRRDRAAGKPIRFPVPITEAGIVLTRYYFADEYKLTPFPLGKRWGGLKEVYCLIQPRKPGDRPQDFRKHGLLRVPPGKRRKDRPRPGSRPAPSKRDSSALRAPK